MSGYAGRHRDAVAPDTPVAPVAAAGRRRRHALLIGAGVAVMAAAFSLVALPVITGRAGAATAPPSSTVPSEEVLQLLGQPEEVGQGTSTTVAPSDQPASPTSAFTTEGADRSTSPAAGTVGTVLAAGALSGPVGTTPPAPAGTSPSAASTTPSPSTTATDSTRTAARTLLPVFDFADNEFGCLNAMWSRLGLWGTVAQASSGLAYIKIQYGTPCAAWDHVRATGEY